MGREKKDRMAAFAGWRFAHRGLHAKPDIPENSRAAFERAVLAGYGAELDVHLLKDGTLAVFHDSDLKRMTGKTGILEDHVLEELPGLALAGTPQTIPTLREVLQIFDGKSPLIIELKTWEGNAAALTEAVCRELDSYHGLFCIESFDPGVVLWLRRRRPEIIRGILSQDFLHSRGSMGFFTAFAATFMLHMILTRPDFIAYRFKDRKTFGNRFGLQVLKKQGVSWTLRTPQQLKEAEAEGLWPIFERFEP